MLKGSGFFVAAALAVAILGACDDDNGKPAVKTDKLAMAIQPPATRFGAGWHNVADSHQSVWGFGRPPAAGAESTRADALAGIRTALMANMLPARNNVRIEMLVNRALSSISPPGADGAAPRPMVVLATTPWNDDTLLLWVEVPNLAQPAPAVSIEFDPAAVAAFRTLGDPSALPGLTEAGTLGRAGVLYEIAPRRTVKSEAPQPNLRYATLHDGGADQAVTAADAVGTIDNAPEVVRFAAATAGFGGLLRGDPAMRDLSCNDVIALAQTIRTPDSDGWRAQLIALMYRAQPLIDLPQGDEAAK